MASLLLLLLDFVNLLVIHPSRGEGNIAHSSAASAQTTATTPLYMAAPGCGGNLDGEGIITTPGYPGYFPPHTSCSWFLSAANGSAIVLEFLDFSLDKQSSFLHIWDNVRYQSYSLSGSESNMTSLRLPNQIGLHFISNSFVTNRGFSLRFKSVAVAGVTNSSLFYSSARFTSCGSNLTSEGNFTSPNYPSQYPNSAYCTWKLFASPGKTLLLFCLSLDTESDYDYVFVTSQVYNGTLITYNRISGNSSNCSMNLGVSATVVFTSDTTVRRQGFAFGFRSVPPPAVNQSRFTSCGGALNGSGIITSPNYPASYPSNAFCVWYITAQGGHQLRFSPSFYSVESTYDYVKIYNSSQINENAKIYDIGSSSASLLGVWFGGVFETGPAAVVVFSSDDLIEQRGFSLNFWSELNHIANGSTEYPYPEPSENMVLN